MEHLTAAAFTLRFPRSGCQQRFSQLRPENVKLCAGDERRGTGRGILKRGRDQRNTGEHFK